MIITCPNCRTRYKVAADSISAAGRQVMCATCHRPWTATPTLPKAPEPVEEPPPTADELAFVNDKDTLFSKADEELLDNAFFAAEDAPPLSLDPGPEPEGETAQEAGTDTQALAPAREDARSQAARRHALAQRRKSIDSKMPLARFRRSSRTAAIIALALVIFLGLGFRTELVRAFPEFDQLYARVGLGTNVVGLEFNQVRTLKTRRDGIDVLMVTAEIANVTNRSVDVPPVLISLINDQDVALYEWSVTPAEQSIATRGVADVEAQLTAPPPGIQRVRLTFAHGQNRLEGDG